MSEISILTKPLNFDNWTCRASQAGKVTGEPAGKNPMQKYLDAFSLIQKLEEKTSSGKKLTVNQQEDLLDAKSQIDSLKARRNDIILSQTAKSYCKEVYWSTRTGRIKKIHSMYMENGKLGEPYAIDLISKLDDPDLYEMGMPVYEKCTLPRQFNNHFEGECDIIKSPTIQDIKCNWDISTYFPHVNELVLGKESEIPKWIFNEKENVWELPANNIENSDYECQGIVYMELYGESEFRLRYCLVNMPNELVEQNLKFILRDFGGDTSNPAFATACEEFRKEHDFSDLPISTRVCTFKIERNNDKYLEMCKKVEAARVYLNWYSEQMFYFENPKEVGKFGIESVIVEKLNDKIEIAPVLLENPIASVLERVVTEEVKVPEPETQTEPEIDSLSQLVIDQVENCTTEAELTALYIKHKEFIETSEFKDKIIEDFKSKKLILTSSIDVQVKITDETSEVVIEPIFTEGDIVSENATEGEYREDIVFEEPKPEVDEKVTDESNFTEVLNEINQTETIEITSETNIESIVEPIAAETETDPFLLSIQNLKNIDDAVAFYMDNADNIDDTKYEAIYFAKKDELSNPVDAPKIVKPKVDKASNFEGSKPTSPASNFTVPEKTYDGTERYVIILSDTEKSEPLPFETAKGVILSHLSNSFTAWNTVKTHRDGVLAFYQSNKEVIDREKEFREQVSLLSKNEVERLVEIKKKEITSQLK